MIDPVLFLKTCQNLASSRHVPMLSPDQQPILAKSFFAMSVIEVPFSIEDFSSNVMKDSQTLEARGISLAMYPPINLVDLFRLYLTADKSVYQNIPCPGVFLHQTNVTPIFTWVLSLHHFLQGVSPHFQHPPVESWNQLHPLNSHHITHLQWRGQSIQMLPKLHYCAGCKVKYFTFTSRIRRMMIRNIHHKQIS